MASLPSYGAVEHTVRPIRPAVHRIEWPCVCVCEALTPASTHSSAAAGAGGPAAGHHPADGRDEPARYERACLCASVLIECTRPKPFSQTKTAGEIHATLGQQRHTLEEGSGKVREMKGFAGDARRVLNDMSRRAALHKLMLYIIIVLLLLAIGATLYRMGTHNGRIL